MRGSNLVHAIDTNDGDEPGRVIVGGVLDPPANIMFEKMQCREAAAGNAVRPGAMVKAAGQKQLDWDRPSTRKEALDHAPRGTDNCAMIAAMHTSGKLPLHQDFHHHGNLGTSFTGRLVRRTTVGDDQAVVPTPSGTAWITGFARYVVDPEDPFPNGYTVGDIRSSQNT